MTAKNYSTTPTIALFLIIAVTGILLLLHVGGTSVKLLHEWLGVAFILFALLHVGANWRLMKRYLGGLKMAAIATILVAAIAFAMVPQAESKGNPARAMFRQALQSSLSTLALFYGVEGETIVDGLRTEGYAVSSMEITPGDISRQYNVEPDRVLAIISTAGSR